MGMCLSMLPLFSNGSGIWIPRSDVSACAGMTVFFPIGDRAAGLGVRNNLN